MVIGIKEDKLDEYKRLHSAVWPEVLDILRKYHISNYSIFQKDELLFGYLEYSGDNLAEDFEKMGEEPVMKKWYSLCGPCQQPLSSNKEGEWWAIMDNVFYLA
jgi:L-rhamnose mutarotase